MSFLISVVFYTVFGFLFSVQALDKEVSLSFPKDHSFHSGFQLEWCYFVGNLKTDSGDIGYELSFFRADLGKGVEVFPVHFAISDISKKKHYTAQVLERKYGKLAGYTFKKIWSGDYSIDIISEKEFHIQAQPRDSNIALDLLLSIPSEKEILPQGRNGFSLKSYKYPDYFSFYYSIPKLQTQGWIKIGNEKKQILGGTSWMDHEWSERKGQNKRTSLGNEENSWDWISINLSDGTDIMAFNFRKTKSEASESFATIRKPKGEIIYFHSPGKLSFLPKEKTWKSEKTGRKYPLEWSLKIEDMELEIHPRFEDQEFIALPSTGNIYWEGAINVKGKVSGKEVSGLGYLELKGNQK